MTSESNESRVEMGLKSLEEAMKDPRWRGYIQHLDDSLLAQIRTMPHVWPWFDFFNSPDKPLSPREFLHFWSSLTFEDDATYKIYTPAELLKGK
jgi:hypothetical protein